MLNEEIRPFDYTWRPEYGDGITVSFGFMKDGIWYSKQVALKRPVPEKKLTLKWEETSGTGEKTDIEVGGFP